MLPNPIDNSLLIAASMALLPCGHPDALREVQRQMRLIIQAYPEPTVLRYTDDVVRHAAILHGPPGKEAEARRRESLRAAIGRLRDYLESLPEPPPVKAPGRARSSA